MVGATIELSQQALRLVDDQPRRALHLAGRALTASVQDRDHAAAAVAERARGLAALYLSDLDTAVTSLRSAVRWAQRGREPHLVAEARMSLAFVLGSRGELRQALRVIDAALGADLPPGDRARALTQRAAILQQLGRLDEALAGYREVLPALREGGDWVWVQRVHNNRGLLQVFRHNLPAALVDLRAAEEVCRREGLDLALAIVHENLGFALSRGGDVPGALHHFAEAERLYRSLGAQVGSLLVDRSELLLSVRMVREAREAAQQAVDEFVRVGKRMDLPEGLLLVAAAALLDGDATAAMAAARRATRLFDRQDRRAWGAYARLVVLRCRLAQTGSGVTTAQLIQVAASLDLVGWRHAAADARLLGVRVALRRGDLDTADSLMARVRRVGGPADLRARIWHAEALVRLATGRRRAAARALRAGLRVLEEHRGTLGATDLRAHVSGHRADLAELGLRMALGAESGTARRVLAWAERGRATHLLQRPVRPPDDPVLAGRLAELRAVIAEVALARRTGGPLAPLERRQAGLERAISDQLRRQRANGMAAAPATTPLDALVGELGDAMLIEYVELDGYLQAVTVGPKGARLHRLCRCDEIAALLAHLPFALHRTNRSGRPASAEAAVRLLTDLGRRLDEVLIRPLLGDADDRPIVIVPTGALQSLPWSVLPSCADRPVTVSPSATLWFEASRRPPGGRALLAAAGPGLAGARSEALAVAKLAPEARVLVDAECSVVAVMDGLHTAGVAHIAAHGKFRADNPLFSSLRLADGPLTVYDLQTLPRVPEVVILAACDSGRSLVCAGDELLGLVAAFLTMGTRSLLAAVVPVTDVAAAPLMVETHAQLFRGQPLGQALAVARARLRASGQPSSAAGAGFVCFGAALTDPW